jgi:hypothetical protein
MIITPNWTHWTHQSKRDIDIASIMMFLIMLVTFCTGLIVLVCAVKYLSVYTFFSSFVYYISKTIRAVLC